MGLIYTQINVASYCQCKIHTFLVKQLGDSALEPQRTGLRIIIIIENLDELLKHSEPIPLPVTHRQYMPHSYYPEVAIDGNMSVMFVKSSERCQALGKCWQVPSGL